MATNKIRGNTQIIDETIANAQISTSAAIDTSKLAEGADFIQRDGSVAFTADQSMGSNKVTNVTAGTAATDAVNKSQLDSVAAGLDPKESCRLATTADLSATYASGGGAGGTGQFTVAPTSIDGVAIAQGDRIAVKDQTDAKENGIYVVTATTTIWDRADDHDGSPASEVSSGNYTFIEVGTANAGNGYNLLGDGTLTLNTDDLDWTQFSSTGAVTAGDGIDINAGVISTDLKASGGLKIDTTELAVEPADFAGTGLEDDGSDNLRLATQGNGISGGAGSTLSVDSDTETGGNIEGASVTANGVGLDVSAIAGTNLEADGSANLRISAAAAGAGLTGGAASALAVGAGTGITVNADDVAVDTTVIQARADLILNEIPTGLVNSANTAYVLAGSPASVTDTIVFINGLRQRPTVDYTVATNTVTMTDAPTTGDNIYIDYRK